MKTNLLLFLLGLFIFSSCGGTNQENEADSDTLETKEVATEESIDEPEKETSVMFEDYAVYQSKKSLTDKFGEANIKSSIESFAEGTVEFEVSILTDPENGNIIKYVWGEDNTLSWIEASVNIYDENYEITGKQSIKTKNGLTLGMSLSELREWNGANFKYSGFDWDFGGGIYNEEGSKIADSPVKLTLGYSGANAPIGDIEVYADDEKYKDVDIFVSSFTFHIAK